MIADEGKIIALIQQISAGRCDLYSGRNLRCQRGHGGDKPAGVQDLDTAPAEKELIAFEEGDRSLPEGCKIIKKWHF